MLVGRALVALVFGYRIVIELVIVMLIVRSDSDLEELC